MKLKLPIALLSAVLSCMSAWATETIHLNDYDNLKDDLGPSSSIQFVDKNLTISGYWVPEVYVESLGEYMVCLGLYWQAGDAGADSYTLEGSGTIDMKGRSLMIEGGRREFSGPPASGELPGMRYVHYTIGSGVVFQDGTLEAEDGAQVVFNGSLKSTMKDDSCTFSVYSYQGYESTIDLTNATIRETDDVELYWEYGGTIIRPQYTVSSTHALSIWPDGDSVHVSAGTKNVLQGNLTLSNGGRVVVYGAPVYLDEEGSQDIALFYHYSTLTVTGTVTVSGNASVIFFNDYPTSYDGSPVYDYVSPEAGQVVFYCAHGVGNTDLLTVMEGRIHSNEWDDLSHEYDEEFRVNRELKLAFVPQADGRDALTVLAVGDNVPSGPEPDTVFGDGGVAEGTLDSDHVVWFSSGGEIDATGVEGGLNNSYVRDVSGSGGTLVTRSDQTFEFSSPGSVSFSIVGQEDEAGADLLVGKEGGLSADYQLKGAVYESALTSVKSGRLTIGEQTTLGMGAEESELSISSGSASRTTSVVNKGTVAADVTLGQGGTLDNLATVLGDVKVQEGSALYNDGSVAGLVTVQQGARAQGGGSFARTLVEQGGILSVGTTPQSHEALTLSDGATVEFSLNGTQPGSYSQLLADSLTLNGTTTAKVTVGLGLLSQGSGAVTLALAQAETLSGDGSWLLDLKDEYNLLKDGAEISWDEENHVLTLIGEVNPSAVAALAGGDGANIANALWSSTNTVRNFARHALSRLQAADGSHVWVSGLGSFLNMGADGEASGFRYNGGGYAVGADYAWTEKFCAGVALGQEFGRFKTDDHQARIKQESLMTGLYARYQEPLKEREYLTFSGYVAFGTVENKADTSVGGVASLPGHAKWDDTVWTFGLQGEWEKPLTSRLTLAPYVGLEYVHGAQDDFSESFAGGHRAWRDGAMQVWRVPVGVTLKASIPLGDVQKLLPEVGVAYVGDIARQAPHVRSTMYGVEQKHKGSEPGRSAFQLHAGTNWEITPSWSAGAFYTLEARSGQTAHAATATVRYSF